MSAQHPPIPPGQDMIKINRHGEVILVVRDTDEDPVAVIFSHTPEGRYVIAAVWLCLIDKSVDQMTIVDAEKMLDQLDAIRAWGGLDK
jgi:hypothetical protein